MKRPTALGLASCLLLTACSAAPGGGTPAGDQGTPPPAPGQTAAPGGAAPTPPGAVVTTNPDDPLGFGEEANTAVVTIGDQRYEFSNLYCVTLGGAMGAVSVGGEPTVDIDLPPMDWETSAEDWDPPGVEVDVGDENWIADADDTGLIQIEPGLSQVDSFESDGYHATGRATFMEASAWNGVQMGLSDEAPDPVQGTFEVTCPRR